MPYITKQRRDELHVRAPETPGELNYLFTMHMLDYVDNMGLSYQVINDIIGALEGAKLEFYRRVVNGYENQAKENNGDIYG